MTIALFFPTLFLLLLLRTSEETMVTMVFISPRMVFMLCHAPPPPPQRVTWVGPQSTYIGRDETGSVYLPTQLERTLQLYG
jgi:hypothetical protein